ncbi:right-handed parallel beta-helix repeat-containing protein [Haloplanus natans]|uniref:right-handed parallel beta-helix repeat-containing protein n=1 Tax=Haloplanus natans TaxID=376171 RepID=UPI000677C66E|nr:right-handed parallel beta-helix repeat-containing protein [Haloplanus natans]
MTRDDLTLSRRKALAALGSVGVASAGAGLGTSAYFSDQETFENNQLTAGTLDMKVAWDEHYSDWMDGEAAVAGMPNGGMPTFRLPPGTVDDGEAIELVVDDGPGFLNATRQEQGNGGIYGSAADLCTDDDADATGAPLIDLADVKPGDFGFGLFRFQLCDNPGKLWLTGGLERAAEADQTEPEADDPDEYGDAGATNPALVELLDAIQVAFGVGTTRDLAAADPAANLLPEPDPNSAVPQPATQFTLREFLTLARSGDGIPLAGDIDAETGGGSGRPCFAGGTAESGEGHYVSVVWWLPIDHGNEVQSDEATFDLGFYTEQCRHNGTADAYVESGESLQAAINAADEGDTVEVAADRFEVSGDPLVVDTPGLTLRSVGPRATIARTDAKTGAAVDITADDVTFERFEVTYPGGLLGIKVTGPSSGVTVRNNRIRDVGPFGNLGVTGIIAQGGAHEDLTIENNLVENLSNEIGANAGFPTVNGIFVDDTSIADSTIANNVVRDLESDIAPIGIILNPPAENVTVAGNYVTDLLASPSVDSDDTDDATSYSFTFAQGINITSDPTTNVAVVENTVTDVTSDVQFRGEAVKIDGDASGVALNRNNLLAPFGVNNADGSELDATDNWWGDPAGPEVATGNPPSTTDPDRRDVLGNVDFDPFLTESYD